MNLDEEDEIQKGNALIRANLHVDPYGLSPEDWALYYNQATWLEGFRLRNTAKMWNMVLQDGEIKPILPHLWTQSRKTISFLPKVND